VADVVEAVEYLPAPHAVQVVAPVAVSVSVTLPAAQVVQDVDPALLAYVPAAHFVAVVAALLTAVPPLFEAKYPAGTCEQDVADAEEE